MLRKLCIVDGCKSGGFLKGMCNRHYKLQWRTGSTTNKNNMSGIILRCTIDNCDKKILAKGLCNKHYARKFRNGHTDLVRPQENSSGYISIQIDGAPVHEHVYLAEKALGRRLPPGTQVHHMNKNRADNYTYFNLVVCPDQKYHALLHKRMRLQELGLLK
jgi:hypothetical protein